MLKSTSTSVSLTAECLTVLRGYCAEHDKKLSRVVERAILEYLKTQGVTPPDNPTAK